MPDSNQKLFAVLLGGRAERCNIELHDIQFTVATNIEDAYLDLLDKWFGIKASLHVDSYMELDVVDGFQVSLSNEKPTSDQRLYFINLGAYEDGNFTELHETAFLVDSSEGHVKKRAKNSLLQRKLSVHTDDLYDVDDCISIAQINGLYVHLTPTDKSENLIPTNGYLPLPKAVIADYLAKTNS